MSGRCGYCGCWDGYPHKADCSASWSTTARYFDRPTTSGWTSVPTPARQAAGTRRWFKLGGMATGAPIAPVYHHIERGAKKTAWTSGRMMPHAVFWGSPGKRCPGCQNELKLAKEDK